MSVIEAINLLLRFAQSATLARTRRADRIGLRDHLNLDRIARRSFGVTRFEVLPLSRVEIRRNSSQNQRSSPSPENQPCTKNGEGETPTFTSEVLQGRMKIENDLLQFGAVPRTLREIPSSSFAEVRFRNEL